jgi:beta-lactamase regulating signal transducer with metallopeptidase domain
MQPTAIVDGVLWALPGAGGWLADAGGAFSQNAAAMAVTSTWQGMAVAAALALCLRLAPRISAGHRFAMWAAGFTMLAGLPFLPLIAHALAGGGNGVSSGLGEASTKPWMQLDVRWSLAVAALWIAVSVYRVVDLAIHTVRLRKVWTSAIPIEDGKRPGGALANLTELCGRRTVQICKTAMLQRPSVIGFLAPRILIPDWLLARLTPGELEQIVLHEAEHLRRRDDWTNLMQKLCLVLFPLNPALWWIERQMCMAREMACDEGVVRVTHAPRAYAACLASLAERGLQRRAEALSLGAWQGRPELVHRVHGVLRRTHALSPVAAHTLLGVLGCGLVFGAVELAQCPQLIEFVPMRTAETAQSLTPVRPLVGPARLVRAAYEPGFSAGLARTAKGFNATKLGSTRQDEMRAAKREEQGALVNSAAEGEEKTSVAEAAIGPQRQGMQKAEVSGTRLVAGGEQQWIVLTAWEQVQTSNAESAQVADYDASADTNASSATSEAKGQTSGQAKSRITVTRLIFRVLPAGSISTQPDADAFRGGWFVIQL